MEKIDLFIGHFSEGGTTDLPTGVSFAGNYYQNKIRSILKINHSVSVFYGGKNKKYESNDGFENVVLKQGSNISNILHIVRHLLTISSKVKVHSTILFYNLNIYTLFYFAYFKFIKKAKVVVLLADAGFLLEHGRISQLVSKALSFSHGILTLREIPELRKFKSKIEVMPGIISKDRYFIETEKTPNTVLLSGSLGITTGLVLALEYFSNQSQLKLIITGVPYLMSNAEFESLLSRYKNRNIEYLGILDYKEYIKVSTSCEFGLSLRNPNDIEHHYNFPSKILEYMSYGNIVVSSLKYPELKDDVYYFTSYSIPGLNECFNTVLATSKGDRELLSSNARYFVETNFSGEVLKAKIEKLLDDC